MSSAAELIFSPVEEPPLSQGNQSVMVFLAKRFGNRNQNSFFE